MKKVIVVATAAILCAPALLAGDRRIVEFDEIFKPQWMNSESDPWSTNYVKVFSWAGKEELPESWFSRRQLKCLYLGTGAEFPAAQPIHMTVRYQTNRKDELPDLTEEHIRSKVELQLRRNTLSPAAYGGDSWWGPRVHIVVQVVGKAFHCTVRVERSLSHYLVDGNRYALSRPGTSDRVTTFEKSSLGTHGGRSKYIMDTLLDLIDELSNAILTAHERVKADSP